MAAGEQLCFGASTELLTSLNGGTGSDWLQPPHGHLRTPVRLFLPAFLRFP